jgi:hypothetical protein
MKLMSSKNEDYFIDSEIIFSILFDNQEIKIINLENSTVIDLRNKSTILMDVLPEFRHYLDDEG